MDLTRGYLFSMDVHIFYGRNINIFDYRMDIASDLIGSIL